MLTEQDKADIRAGLTLYAGEIRAVDPEMEHWAADCDRFAEALEGQWQAETSPSQDMTQINMELGGM